MMKRSLSFGTRAVRAGLALVLLAACSDLNEPTFPQLESIPRSDSYWSVDAETQPFTVYTQNVYQGGDTNPIFGLDFNDIPALVQATNVFWNQVQTSHLAERAAAVVDEIDARRPHVVGLQEVFQIAAVDLTTGAVVGGSDPLAAIEAEIAARGLPYEVVRVQSNTSAVLPLAVDLAAGAVTRILSVTDRVAALRRTDVTLTDSDQGTYAARFNLGPLTLTRGWIRMDLDFGGVPYHFVTTHLEVQGLAPVQAGQANELLNNVMAGLQGVTILAGDLNSDANGEPGVPSWTPTYDLLTGAGFTDAWIQSGQPAKEPGFTCCQDADLRNPYSVLDERIDLVLVRSADPAANERTPGAIRVEIVGEELGDLTPSALWPSDHAGLVAGLRLPDGLNRANGG